MPILTNPIPSSGGDLQGVLYETIEAASLAYNIGSGVPSSVTPARLSRIGGIDAAQSLGASAFWQPDGLGGMAGAYALAAQVLPGNAAVDPRLEAGRTLRHYGMPIPVGYRPSLIPGGLDALPFGYEFDLVTVLRKASNAGAADVFAVGLENPNVSSIFLNAQGSIGVLAFAPGNSGTMTQALIRADGSNAASGTFVPLLQAVDVATAAVRFRMRVRMGRGSWLLEMFANDVLILSVTDAQMGYVNLNQCTGTEQLMAYPRLYAGSNQLAGPYYSRATVRLIEA